VACDYQWTYRKARSLSKVNDATLFFLCNCGLNSVFIIVKQVLLTLEPHLQSYNHCGEIPLKTKNRRTIPSINI
jgi:hypothetical protein